MHHSKQIVEVKQRQKNLSLFFVSYLSWVFFIWKSTFHFIIQDSKFLFRYKYCTTLYQKHVFKNQMYVFFFNWLSGYNIHFLTMRPRFDSQHSWFVRKCIFFLSAWEGDPSMQNLRNVSEDHTMGWSKLCELSWKERLIHLLWLAWSHKLSWPSMWVYCPCLNCWSFQIMYTLP